jgi:hypothetical protein
MGDPTRDLSKSRASRFVASGLAVAVLAAVLALSSAIPASADVPVCGVPQGEPTVPQGEPTYDLNGVLQLTTQGNETVINEIRRALNLGTEWCGPLRFATKVGARVVAGRVWELVEVKVPLQYDVIIAVVEEVWESLHPEAPSQAPAETPSQLPHDASGGSGVLAPVAWTGGIGLHLRPSPARTASIGTVPEGATVSIVCTTRGETVSGPFGPTDLWDYVVYNGQAGYVSDGYVNTGTNDPVAPSC